MTPTLQERRQQQAAPFDGMTIYCKEQLATDALQQALSTVVDYLSAQFSDTPLAFFPCWLEHDGIVLEETPTTWETLRAEISHPETLAQLFDDADFAVRRAFVAADNTWLLRFSLDEDPGASPRLGDFDLTISYAHGVPLLEKLTHGPFDFSPSDTYFDLKEHGPSLLEVSGAFPVGRITLNRPAEHNALNARLVQELTATIQRLGSASWIEAIVLTGNGNHFCVGADSEWLGTMAESSDDKNLACAKALQTLFETVAHCPKVVIAAVNGAATGDGAGLVAACDYAIASDKATFAFPEVKRGIVPGVLSPFVVEKIGLGAARAYFTTGRRFDAATALRLGLVQEVVAEQDLSAAVNSVLTDACSAGPKAIAASKELLRALAAGTADPTEASATLCASPEGQEGIRALLEKRTPLWKRDS